jgi:restriction endonuclease Mrr
LYSTGILAEGRRLVASVTAVNDELVAYLARHPELMHHLDPRKFEELVAELLRAQGFRPTLTPQTRDGGRDIIATRSDALGELLYLVECKRYAPHRKVGVQQVRGIFGVAQAERATKAVLVTTSSFTSDAVAFASPLKYDITLRDYEALKSWIQEVALRHLG